MKTRTSFFFTLILLTVTSRIHAQGTAFTYQGQLKSGGNPVTGAYDLTFTLFATNATGIAIAGPTTNSATPVNNGLFSVTLDFGNQFAGADRWLEIGVRTNGGGTFTTLSPRQPITPAPYAIYAANAGGATAFSGTISASQLTGTVSLAQLPVVVVTNGESGVNISGTFTGNGAALTNLNYSALVTPGTNRVYDATRAFVTGVGMIMDVNGTNINAASTLNGSYHARWISPQLYLTNDNGGLGKLFWSTNNSMMVLFTNLDDSVNLWAYDNGTLGTNGLPVMTTDWSDGLGHDLGNIGQFGTNYLTVYTPTLPLLTNDSRKVTLSGVFSGSGVFTNQFLDLTNLNNEAWVTERSGSLYRFQHFGRGTLLNTLAKIRSGKNVRIMMAGQGLTEYFEHWVFNIFESNFVYAGAGPTPETISSTTFPLNYHIFQGQNGGTAYSTNSGGGAPSLFYNLHAVLPNATAVVTWQDNFTRVVGNTFEVEYIGYPGAGHFKVQTNLNGGTFTDLSGATDINASTSAGVTNMQRVQWTTPGNAAMTVGFKAVWLSGGPVELAGAMYEDTTVSPGGYMPFVYRNQGSGYTDMLEGGPGVYTNMLAFWKPDLIVMMSLSDQTSSLQTWISAVKTYLPNTDFIGFGVNPNDGDAPSVSISENTAMRDCCRTNGYAFFDAYNVAGASTNYMASRGWGTGVHPPAIYWNLLSKVFYDWLGF